MAGNAGALARKAKPTLDAGGGARVPSIDGARRTQIETDPPPELSDLMGGVAKARLLLFAFQDPVGDHQHAQMICVVVGEQKCFAQDRLAVAVLNFGEQIR